MTRPVPRRHVFDPRSPFGRKSSGGNSGSSRSESTSSRRLAWLWAGLRDAAFSYLLPHLHRSFRHGEWASLTELQPLPLSPSPPPTLAQRRLPRSVAQLFLLRKRRSRRHRASRLEQQRPVVSEMDFFLSPHRKPETVHHPPKQKTVYYDYRLYHHPRQSVKNIHTAKADSFSHSIIISSPIVQSFPVKAVKAQPVPVTAPQAVRAEHAPAPVPRDDAADGQPTPIPVPAPRARAAETQSTSAPVPAPRVGVTGVQLAPVPVKRPG
ncbi:hypothetical protein ACER0C_012081 [Sarotherodon galilaeus]